MPSTPTTVGSKYRSLQHRESGLHEESGTEQSDYSPGQNHQRDCGLRVLSFLPVRLSKPLDSKQPRLNALPHHYGMWNDGLLVCDNADSMWKHAAKYGLHIAEPMAPFLAKK